MKSSIKLINNLLILISSFSILAYDVHITISNSSSRNSSYYQEHSRIEYVKQTTGIYHSRQHLQNSKANNQAQIVSAQEYDTATIAAIKQCHQEQIQREQIKSTFTQRLPELKTIVQDTQELQTLYQEYNQKRHTYLEKRLIALRDVQTGTIPYEIQSYQLNSNIVDVLHVHGINKDNYSSLFGNKLQQIIHQECINILEQTVDLSLDSPLYDHKFTLVECAESARAFNQQGNVDKAIKITNFCWSLLDYGKAIIEGIAAGIIGAVQDVVEHPVGTIISLAIGEYLLAYNLSKILIDVGHIGITAITDKREAKKQFDNYLEPINRVINAIEKEEINLKDAIRGATQLAIGFYAQTKLLGGLGKFYKGIQNKAHNFITKNPSLKPEHYLATSEGLLLNVINPNLKSHSKRTLNCEYLKKQTRKSIIKKHQLPTKGKIRYVPPKWWNPTERLPQKYLSKDKVGYIDKFDNIWVKGESRTLGQLFEWDVQLSKQGKHQLGWMTRDNTHLNVSLDGRVTHK